MSDNSSICSTHLVRHEHITHQVRSYLRPAMAKDNAAHKPWKVQYKVMWALNTGAMKNRRHTIRQLQPKVKQSIAPVHYDIEAQQYNAE